MLNEQELKAHYEAVLKDLHAERAGHLRSARDLDQTIASIANRLQHLIPAALIPVGQPSMAQRLLSGTASSPVHAANHQRWATMSVRWAILHILGEGDSRLTTSEVVEALQAGGAGAQSKANNFSNNVSAVLSDMKNERLELELTDGKWAISDNGRSALAHIKMKAEQQRMRA